MEFKSLNLAQGYISNREAVAPKAGPSTALSAAKDFAHTLETSEQAAIGAISGGVDSQSLVQALAQSELAVETAVTLRNKVVEAYQEILRMPV